MLNFLKRKISRKDVIDLYKLFLNREPESEEAIKSHRLHPDYVSLVKGFLNSPEYTNKSGNGIDFLFAGINPTDIELLQKYLVNSEPQKGFTIDFVGTKMRSNITNFTKDLDGKVFNEIPVPHDFHSEAIEWVGTIKAVEASKENFTVLELGAGWGPWAVSSAHIARKLGKNPIKIIEVEADEGKFNNLRQHLIDNNFKVEDQDLYQAIIGPQDGYAFFPIIDSVANWGGEAIFAQEEPKDGKSYVKLKSVSLGTVLNKYQTVDLIHFDIQGAEADVIENSLEILKKKARYLVIGTHSRVVEGRIIKALLESNFELQNEQPCRCNYQNNKSNIIIDGTQVWRNLSI